MKKIRASFLKEIKSFSNNLKLCEILLKKQKYFNPKVSIKKV